MTATPQTPPPASKRPRRTPAPEERKIDAERSRRLLLEAAKDEFSAKGFAGARVQDIADRAGLNKQLINYYFGGKEGLYEEIGRQWLAEEATFNDPALPLEDVVAAYLRHSLADPRGLRLSVWDALTGGTAQEGAPEDPSDVSDVSDVRRRQAAGELADDLDPAAMLLLFMGAVAAPIVMPHVVRRAFGVEPDSPEFHERYAEQLRRVIRHLA
ncbi:TetR/AcrR family transcriptional regulator [Streptomyces sp. XD-27]|uniref:TetR/AcrR family transcriptional regulator n=1 Tax=Streptomyces sp. XD-27 TaxID=3062779 RepID=UPI0026F452B4|nr:TetR family transcriptional regulator [Streptomyces sp. XD-27]WKX72134.1 TetR family transcriptional regulator [Streptomyces sp. XD-27]